MTIKKNDLGSLIALCLASAALFVGIAAKATDDYHLRKLHTLERDEGLKAQNLAKCGTTAACFRGAIGPVVLFGQIPGPDVVALIHELGPMPESVLDGDPDAFTVCSSLGCATYENGRVTYVLAAPMSEYLLTSDPWSTGSFERMALGEAQAEARATALRPTQP